MRTAKEIMVVESDRGMRRVSVYADGAKVDLVLPAEMPVAALIPSIQDIVAAETGRRSVDPVPDRYQLSRPGMPTLNPSTTLAQNAVRDGAVLVLTKSSTELPAPCFDDPAEAVSTALAAVTWPWTRRAARIAGAAAAVWLAGLGGALLVRITLATNGSDHSKVTAGVAAVAGCAALAAAAIAHRAFQDEVGGLTLGLLAIAFVTVAGFVAVPDGPGAPNVLLAAMASAVTSIATMWLTGCAAVAFTAVSCLAIVIAGTALAAVITGAPLHVIGSMSAVASLGLLELSPRVSIAWAGLSPRLPPPVGPEISVTPNRLHHRAIQADERLTSLVVAFASAAAIGAVCTSIDRDGSRLSGVVFATLTGAALLLRARSHLDLPRTLGLLVTGTATVSIAFVVAAANASQHTAWIAAGATTMTAAAVYLGFVAPGVTFSPVARRGVELLEYVSFAAMVPLACWICGFYSAARRLHLV